MNLLQRSIRNESGGGGGGGGIGGAPSSSTAAGTKHTTRYGGATGGGFTSGFFGLSGASGSVLAELTGVSTNQSAALGGPISNSTTFAPGTSGAGQSTLDASHHDPILNCNYGKLFPPHSLRYLHRHNHLHDFPPELLARSQTPRPIPIVRSYHSSSTFAASDSLSKTSVKSKNSSSNRSLVFRISLLDTDVYQAQDVPSSPQHAPHPRPELPSPAHAEWVRRTVQRLRSQFPPPHSLLLVNVEKRAKYPFVLFGSPGPRYSASAGPIMPTAATSALSHELRITDGLYEECDSVRLPEMEDSANGGCATQPLGYIISAYQTFPGEDSEKLEESWFVWTGGGHLARYLPTDIGLRRLVFYKRRDLHLLKSNCLKQFVDNELPIFTYVLFAELYQLQQHHLPLACAVIDQLRARCCGYTALYINCT